jgi:TM2 domain-containing membrane protein YozV
MKRARREGMKINASGISTVFGRTGIFRGMSNGQGSAGNVIAALCSFFIPGLGQLVQGRILMALIMFVLAGVLWIFWLGWIIHLWSVIDAALYHR